MNSTALILLALVGALLAFGLAGGVVFLVLFVRARRRYDVLNLPAEPAGTGGGNGGGDDRSGGPPDVSDVAARLCGEMKALVANHTSLGKAAADRESGVGTASPGDDVVDRLIDDVAITAVVDYAAIRDSAHFERLQRLARLLPRVPLGDVGAMEAATKTALYLNLYNALFIHAHIARGLPTSYISMVRWM